MSDAIKELEVIADRIIVNANKVKYFDHEIDVLLIKLELYKKLIDRQDEIIREKDIIIKKLLKNKNKNA